MTSEIRHHYVPQFLLKNWSIENNNIIYEFNKDLQSIKQRSIKKQICLEKNFYYQWYEELLASFENKISSVFKEIITAKIESDYESIINNNKIEIAKFIVLQNMRTLFANRTIREMLMRRIKSSVFNRIGVINNLLLSFGLTEEELIDEYDKKIESVIKDAHVEFINIRLEQVSILHNYKWFIKYNNTETSFLATDLGVVAVNLIGLPQLATEELFLKGTEIIMPITPSICLCLYENTVLEQFKSPLLDKPFFMICDDKQVFIINQIQANYAYKYVYSNCNNKDYISGLLR